MKVIAEALTVLSCAVLFPTCFAAVANVVVDHRHHPHHKHKKPQHATATESAPAEASEKKEANGMPHLPAVTSMLGQASETLKGISEQAITLETRVSQLQKENMAKMSRQKSVFDRRLETQEEGSREVEAENAQITKEIAQLKEENNAVRKHAKDLQVDNRLMRIELQQLQAKLGVSRDFVANSLTVTDDSKAKDLLILKTKDKDDKTTDEDSHDQDDDDDREDSDDKGGDDDDDGDDDAPSLLSVASRTRRAEGDDAVDLDAGDAPKPEIMNPKDLLKVLQKGVENLATEEKEGEAKLKTMFLTNFRTGLHRHTTLIAEQKALNVTRASVKDKQVHLKAAEAHLKHTKSHLEERLRGLGLFLQKLAHVAMAPLTEAPQMIKALPSTVSIPSEEAARKKDTEA